MSVPKTLTKYPEELRTYSFNFEDQPEIADDSATIVSVEVGYPLQTPSTGASTLTFGGNQIQSPEVHFTITGGTAGIRYQVAMMVVLSTGAKLKEYGIVSVVEQTMPPV